jgi:hypothetical protein
MTQEDKQLHEGETADNSFEDGKKIEFYSQAWAAWFNSNLELDKSILSISVAGIGFLVTMMENLIHSTWTLIFFSAASFMFLTAACSVLLIFRMNGDHIVNILKGKKNNGASLKALDLVVRVAFALAIVFSAALGMNSAVNYHDGGMQKHDRK